jgi:hypothetical protein
MQQGKEFKALEGLLDPDGSSVGFSVEDPSHPQGFRPLSLEDTYGRVALLSLPESVPPEIRGYFDTARTLWVFGWYHYPFYTWAGVHADLCAEMGLRWRLKAELGPRASLNTMLNTAVEKGWLRAEGFTRMRNRHANRAWMRELLESIGHRMPPDPGSEDLKEVVSSQLVNFRKLRNLHVHADGLSYMPPGTGYVSLEFSRDLLVQLFPRQDSGAII